MDQTELRIPPFHPFVDVRYYCGCQRSINQGITFHPAEDRDRAGPSRVHNPDVQCICPNPHIGSLMYVENPAFAAQLMKKGASVNYTDSEGSTPLHRCWNVEMAAWLIENSVNINCTNDNGDTPLHTARTFEIAAWLIDHGADIHSRNSEGETPLHKLTLHCKEYTQPMKFIIEKGANVEATNHRGQTPLHYAVHRRLKGAVATLLYYNADTSARDHNGFTPIMYNIMSHRGAPDCLIHEMLLGYEDDFSCSANGEPTLLTLAVVNQSPYLDEMISLGVDFSNLRREVRILLWCIQQRDIEEFKWFWDIFDYKESWHYCNSILDFLLAIKKYSLFHYVLESPKMDVVIEVQHRNERARLYIADHYQNNFSAFTMTSHQMIACFEAPDINISKVLDATVYRSYNKSKAEQTMFVLLSYGYVASKDDAYRIFKLYGYGPLFELLLHLDVQKEEHLHRIMINMPPPLLAKVLLNPGIDARKYIVSQRDEEEEAEEEEEEEDEEIKGAYVSDREVIFMGVGVPSLLEFSRNQARLAIWNGYKIQNTKQFYTTVNRMVIPSVIKDILNLKLPIYYENELPG